MTGGFIIVSIAFITSLVSMIAYFMYYRDRQEALLTLANRAFYVMTAGVVLSLGLLIYSIMVHNFQLNYAYSYSSRILSKYYLFSTLWAGQEGTFLMWLFYGCIYGFILIRTVGRKRPLVMGFLLAVQAFLLLILLKKNPFFMIWHVHEQAPVGFTPADGAGLNPLLQNPWMVIHPPTLFVGYSSTVVPFAFAMSAMITRDFTGWIQQVRPWVIFNVMVLGTGIIMGGYWAYVTLGWGGYWAWDPVENASIVPWLFSIILLHGILIQGKRKALIRTNFLWAGLSFLTMLWGSYLTRSGVLSDFSVHSFAASGLNLYLVVFQVLFTALFIGGFVAMMRYYHRVNETPVEFGNGFLNRETFIFSGMMAVLFLALFVLLGTSAPMITGLMGNATSLSPDFYNAMSIPVAIFMFVAIGLAPLLAWKNAGLRNRRLFYSALGVAAVLTLAATFIGLAPLESIGGGTALYGPQTGGIANDDGLLGFKFRYLLRFAPYVLFFLSVLVIVINGQATWLFIRNNMQKAGGFVVHVGLGFMLIGILTSSAYDTSEKILLPQGEFTTTELGYQVKFVDFVEEPDGRDKVKLEIRSKYGSQYDAYPRFYYSEYSEAYMVNPDVKAQFSHDVYISPISFTPAAMANEKTLELQKTQKGIIDERVALTFNSFKVDMSGGSQSVTALLDVRVSDESGVTTNHAVSPEVHNHDGEMHSDPVAIPGTAYRIKINSVNAGSGTVRLGIIDDGAGAAKARDMLAIEISEKPLISILWFGTLIFIAGSFMSLLNRRRDARNARQAA